MVEDGGDQGVEGLALVSIAPETLLPGTRVVVTGRSLVPDEFGASRLRLSGAMAGDPVEVELAARFVDYDRLEIDFPGAFAAGFPRDAGTFEGDAVLAVDSFVDGALHLSEPIHVWLELADELEPRMDFVMTGVIFVNDPIVVEGEGILLGGGEGDTMAVVEGCFRVEGAASCQPVAARAVPVTPDTPFDRTRGTFPFDPRIAGIHPGSFEGTITLRNVHESSVEVDSAPQAATYEVVPSKIFRFSPPRASLGQYVRIEGGGFVGARPGSPDQTLLVTTIELEGTFTPAGASSGANVTVTLVPEFVSGPLVRYVVNEEDDVGQRIEPRHTSGSFVGRARPVVQLGAEVVTGDWTPVDLGIDPVKQVVWLRFLPGYVESLRHFGLRAVEDRIRARVLEVARRDYGGLNVEFRTEAPEDFALFATVDISGPDPNGLGLLGYDNSPGKDVENARLYDKIGGVNATTQEDGYPGYGGVFVESFFGFSEHPGGFADRLDGADPLFDRTFDPFRPDRGGEPVRAADLVDVPVLADAWSCPGADRATRIACAVFVLGSMIGSTMTHEVGHSFGLSNPYGEGFHNPGDQTNRLMDAGGARSFGERAELNGEGPAVFCDDEYEYLRGILPAPQAPPAIERPSCY
jgi:hypothetical protein